MVLAGYWIVAFSLYVEPQQSFDDDTALANMMVKCRRLTSASNYYETLDSDGSDGVWGDWSHDCPLGEAVVAASVKYETPGLLDDETGVGDVRMVCG